MLKPFFKEKIFKMSKVTVFQNQKRFQQNYCSDKILVELQLVFPKILYRKFQWEPIVKEKKLNA